MSAIDVLSAAKRLGEKSDWTLSNLQMQKMCYIAHMFYMSQSKDNKPLIAGEFEAWEYGPVHPKLYHALKMYGASWVPQGAFKDIDTVPENHPGTRYLDRAVAELPRRRLIGITHWEGGAWKKKYEPRTRGLVISNKDIVNEYNAMMEQDSKASNS